MHYPIRLKFGTLKGRIKAHHDTKFGHNIMNGHDVINNYSQKYHQYVVMPTGLAADGKKVKFGKETG